MSPNKVWSSESILMCVAGALVAGIGIGQATNHGTIINAWIMIVVGAGAVLLFGTGEG